MRPQDRIEEQEWIDKYLDDKLSPPERFEFENELKNDKLFKDSFDKMKALRNTINDYFIEQAMRDQIQLIKDRKISKRKIFKLLPLRISITGFAALIIFALYLIFSPIVLPDSDNDFTITRGLKTTKNDKIKKTSFDYFFEAQSKFYEGQYLLSSQIFEKVLKDEELRPYFKEATEWHLLLAYIKSNQNYKARELYKNLSNCIVPCNYELSTLNRWKIWWQIRLLSIKS